jgi:DNA repair protein RecO (recombination protein O)
MSNDVPPVVRNAVIENRSFDVAYVLHGMPYRETSQLLDVFTCGHGRMRLLAKGSKRGRRPLTSLLQPFVRLSVSWSGYGDLPLLNAAEQDDNAAPLLGLALYCGFYINELVLYLLPLRDPHPAVFRNYQKVLRRLSDDRNREESLRLFEISLLEEIGYGLPFDRDALGQDIDEVRHYAFCPDSGFVQCAADTHGCVTGATLLSMMTRNLASSRQLVEAKRLMRNVIGHRLNGRALKSRDLFTQRGRTADL